MKRTALLIGLLLALAAPRVTLAASGDFFHSMFEDTSDTYSSVYPKGAMETFIIEAMREWNDTGIVLTSADIRAAVNGNHKGICSDDKVDTNGKKIEFTQANCYELMTALVSLIRGEQEAVLLAKDLLFITNGSELSVSDEPNRPVHMPHTALLLRRVWSGTGGGIIPWNEDHDDLVSELDTLLSEESDIDAVIRRFRHGYFRDRRENDPTLQGIGDPIRDKLRQLADALGISGDQQAVGEFAVPKLSNNMGFWARKDDIGLYWVYPIRFKYWNIQPGGTYPRMVSNGENLAYPYSYEGSNPRANIRSPLCSKTTARQGYLCRTLPVDVPNCENTGSDDEVVLVKCSEKNERHDVGPLICRDLQNLYVDDGTPLTIGNDNSRLNPDLTPADTRNLCTPETKTLYQDEIIGHACFVGHCLEQTMSGNTIIPNRNTTLVSEATSPYLACMRTDPQLGVYTETATDTPYSLPPYIGHELVMNFEQFFCAQNGKTAHPVLGFCRYRDEDRAKNPPKNQAQYIAGLSEESFMVDEDLDTLSEAATAIGYKASLDQSLEVHRKVFAKLTGLVQQVADLLNELKRAPLTKAPCPWTGPFSSASSSDSSSASP